MSMNATVAKYYLGASTFSLGALGLWIPSGYSIGAVALLLGSLAIILLNGRPRLSSGQVTIIVVIIAYSLIWMTDGIVRGDGVRDMDQASRFLFAVPVILAVSKVRPSLLLMWFGCGIGGFGALSIAAYQVYIEQLPRASGFIGPEPFGNISSLLAGLSLLGAVWFWVQRSYRHYAVLNFLGGGAALLALVLSGTRASWLAFIVMAGLIIVVAWREIEDVRVPKVLGIIFLSLAALFSTLDFSIRDRVIETYSDISSYFDSEAEPRSVGKRFEVWKGSLALFLERPLLGWGNAAFGPEMQNLASSNIVHESVGTPNHAHNEVIDALAKKGIVGFASVVLVYCVPAVFFLRLFLLAHGSDARILAASGLLLVTNFVFYGMAHTGLENNAGVMNYAFWLALFAGCSHEGSCSVSPARGR
jgi:O-antigen ligase